MSIPNDPAEESRLLQAAKHDPESFVPIYERYAPRIYAYCLRRIGNQQDAEDLTSQVFTQALARISTYRGGLVSAWLFQIAFHIVVDYVRCHQTVSSLTEVEVAQDTPGMMERLVQHEEQRQIRALLGTLPAEQQELLALRITAGLSAEETGAVVGKSPGAIRTSVHRALRRLRELYEQAERKEQA